MIAVTSARDLAVVRAAVSLGVVQYLLKPFTFAALRDKLERYADYRAQALADGEVAAQHEVDRMFATLRGTAGHSLPKGLDAQTLDRVRAALTAGPRAPGGLSATEVSALTGISRVTARRYLEYLVTVDRRPPPQPPATAPPAAPVVPPRPATPRPSPRARRPAPRRPAPRRAAPRRAAPIVKIRATSLLLLPPARVRQQHP